jgi:hypothetical protein
LALAAHVNATTSNREDVVSLKALLDGVGRKIHVWNCRLNLIAWRNLLPSRKEHLTVWGERERERERGRKGERERERERGRKGERDRGDKTLQVR